MIVREILPLYALGVLEDDEVAEVERALESDATLRAELDGYREAETALGDALPLSPPDPSVRARLMASVDALIQPGRWDRYAARLAEIFDVTVDKARMFLGWVDDPSRWEGSPFPGLDLRVVHLPAGPAWAGADCGLVRMPPGMHFPWHAHNGPELTLILQGRIRLPDGRVLGPGDEMLVDTDEEHDFVVEEASEEYIFAVRFYGIEVRTPPKPE